MNKWPKKIINTGVDSEMWLFLTAGIVYMVGVAVVLVVKPSFMFTPDGRWKEFGIGKGTEKYTTFPFWMFCLVWAFISFSLILFLEPTSHPVGNVSVHLNESVEPQTVELPKGYYVLNKKATTLSGVPKYVYLGPEEPSN
jgi:hypothetical protein